MNVDPQSGTLALRRGDRIADIPETHICMLSEPARALFADPAAYFARLTAACPFPQMARWLAAVAADGGGELHRLIPRYRGIKSARTSRHRQ